MGHGDEHRVISIFDGLILEAFALSAQNNSKLFFPCQGFANGGYERDTTRYAQGTGELIVGDILNALHELKK